ncbi:Uncharacterised protein [Bordetella pertussis]|nr:Uncharacterised protein [Bordetella pertussis]CFW38480.1 Uncharacterised protein [Bordetella pertussis]
MSATASSNWACSQARTYCPGGVWNHSASSTIGGVSSATLSIPFQYANRAPPVRRRALAGLFR